MRRVKIIGTFESVSADDRQSKEEEECENKKDREPQRHDDYPMTQHFDRQKLPGLIELHSSGVTYNNSHEMDNPATHHKVHFLTRYQEPNATLPVKHFCQ